MFYDQDEWHSFREYGAVDDEENVAGIRSDLDFFLWTGELEDYFGAGFLQLALDCLDYEEGA
jgi:hypothetical protein